MASEPIDSSGESARGGTLGGRIALRFAGRLHPAILTRLIAARGCEYPWGYTRKAAMQSDPSVQLKLFSGLPEKPSARWAKIADPGTGRTR